MKNINPPSVTLPPVHPALTGSPLLSGEVFLMEEIWKDVTGFEGIYKVSNLGNIKSTNYKCGKKEKVLKSVARKSGYLQVSLCNTKKHTFHIHRIVATEFIPNPENKTQVNHINGIKHDNWVNNLEWVTPSENQIHAYANLKRKENTFNNGKYGKYAVRSIPIIQLTKSNEIIKYWDCAMDVEREMGINHSFISSCCKNNNKSAHGFKWQYKSKTT